jgi:hypothetical protein
MRRLFSTQIVDSDAFLDMPATAQNLYFHLGMRADDDGFVGNPKKVARICGANEDDLKVLIGKRFLLTFESGVVVIKHWLIHNLIRADLYHETQYKKEKATLGLNENGAYTELREGVSELKQIEAPEWLKRRRKERTENGTTSVCKDKTRQVKLSKDNIAQKNDFCAQETSIQKVVNYYLSLTKKDNSEYKKHLRAAKELLELCDNQPEEAKKVLDKCVAEAVGDWSIYWAVKKWLEFSKA